MKFFGKLLVTLAALACFGVTSALLITVSAYFFVAPTQPSVEGLRDIKLQVPLRLYTRDGRLMGEFGEKRRIPVSFDELPRNLVNAFIAAEDDRFFEHPGVDYQGLVRAGVMMAITGERRQGGGTITMQLARNVFLTREKTIERKVREIFLALQIEREFSKQQVLELYLNMIFLGQRAYGVGAAAEVYFGKTLDQLTLAEAATIAGLPKRPSVDNPVSSPANARQRRAYVLRRMLELAQVDQAAANAANAEVLDGKLHTATVQVAAPYVAEMVRAELADRYPDIYTAGYRVTTTLDSRLQNMAVDGLEHGLLSYDQRHGYRGVVASVAAERAPPEELLAAYPGRGKLLPALITEVGPETASAYVKGAGAVELTLESVAWARTYIDDDSLGPEIAAPDEVLTAGAVVYLMETAASGWQLAQVPKAQGALIALDPLDGAVVALTGGFDFYASKFNRAVQARRQCGSSIKPFIYSAALESGLTAATLINDAPVVVEDTTLDDVWRPRNYSQKFFGPTRLREALVRSRNMVSIRLLERIGINFAVNHLVRFGFDGDELPRDLTLSLGSASVTPLQIASAYSVLASGGYRTEPYFIQRIVDTSGAVLFEANPAIVCAECEIAALEAAAAAEPVVTEPADQLAALAPASPPADPCKLDSDKILADPEQVAPRVLDAQNAYLIVDMMRDVVRRGTGARVRQLGRDDLAGKTGTSNDFRDAWFSGFNGDLVATTWIGFDQERPLGRREAGGVAALPAWMSFMGAALTGVEESPPEPPPGLVTVRISPESGLLAGAQQGDAIFETFRAENVPPAALMGDAPRLPVEGETEAAGRGIDFLNGRIVIVAAEAASAGGAL